jgi:hypothetical protein
MDGLGPVLFHLFGDRLDVASGAAATGREADHFERLVLRITGERSGPFPDGPKALPSAARLIASADDDPDLGRQLHARPVIVFSNEYEYEKNGVRFPSLYRINEDCQQPFGPARRLRISELEVRCRDYKFFTVETEIKGME